ncbi:MAG: aldo/keto reductase [Selenomonadaceae bacterium]|nr:aldo/keto reductase [Selenomonadaceae bacterium]
MKTRKLRNLTVSAVGMGCMGFSHGYGAVPPESESIRLMRSAYEDYGCTFFDTAEVYAAYENEILVGKALKPIRDKIVLATKFMPEVFLPGQEIPEGKTSRKGVRNALEASLKRLQTDYIDLYYEHRVPANRDVAEVATWMGELIKEGKILGWGVSEATSEQIKRAHSVTPLTAVQSEYSIMERKYERDVIPLCKELNIGFVAFSPMAGGFLSGKYSAQTKFEGDDVRRVITRFSKENMEANQSLLDLLNRFAANKNSTPAQISLAWMMCKNDFVVPIPGMRRDERLKENFGAADVVLDKDELVALEKALAKITIHGDRKDSDIQKLGTIKTVAKS